MIDRDPKHHPLKIARRLKDIADELEIPFIFKASYDKANRSSIGSYRGVGLERGLDILATVKAKVGVPILTDVHETSHVERAAQVADVLQIPAFLCRQTDLVLEAARSGRAVNIKKGQFMAPWDMKGVMAKAATTGNPNLMVTERGASFGYNTLVVDMRSFPVLRGFGYPVVFDITHSVQRPGGLGDRSGGEAHFIDTLGPAGVAAGVSGVFMETHEDPSQGPFRRPERLSSGPHEGISRPPAERPARPRSRPAMMPYETARKVLQIEADAIRDLIPKVGESFSKAVDLLFACTGRVVATGMGKSGFIAQKLSATLSSTGTPSLFLHPAEAIHGDLGRIVKGDVVVAISYSGETEEIVALLPTLKRIGVPLVSLTGTDRIPRSPWLPEVHLDVSIREEACPLRLAPTASTTAALAMGDALAMVLTEKRGFTVEEFADLHPGGRLGRKLLRVEDLMHKGDDMPRVGPPDAAQGRAVRDDQEAAGHDHGRRRDGRLLGVISDGDLRRLMERFGATVLGLPAEAGHDPHPPHTIPAAWETEKSPPAPST